MADQTLASLTAATPATGGLLYGTQGGADRKFTLTAAGAALMEAAAPVRLDELAAPTDVTTLNATTGAHGLLPKLGGGTTNFLRADGTWAAPGGGANGLGDFAFVHPSGNDATAALGDPARPFATLAAAYAAALSGSVARFVLSGSPAAGLTLSTSEVTLVFHSFSQRAVIPSLTVSDATRVTLIGSSRSLVSITTLYVYGVDGISGTGGDGGTAGDGTALDTVSLSGLHVGSVTIRSGSGGLGGAGANGDSGMYNGADGGHGGNGASGGQLVLTDCLLGAGPFTSAGGVGGSGGAGGSGYSDESFTGAPGNPGAGGSGGGGGTIVLQSCLTEQSTTPPALDLSGGSSGSGSSGGISGSNGTFTLLWSDIGSATNYGGGFARMSLVGSTFYSSDSYV